MLARKATTFALVSIAALAAICGNGSGKGHLLLAEGGSIFTYDVGSTQAALVTAPVGGGGITLRDPSQSPDGKRIAYVRALQPAGANPNGETDELWIAAHDGTDPHPSLQDAGILITHPQWLDDQTILAIVRPPSGAGLERINAGTGERTPVTNGVTDFVLSRDRSFVVLLRPTQEGPTNLTIAGADGAGERSLVSAPQGAVITALAIAPDGRTVSYATTALVSQASNGDVWSVSAAGGTPTHVASLTEQVVGLTYARDASALYACSASALWAVSTGSGTVTHLRDDDRSTLAWSP